VSDHHEPEERDVPLERRVEEQAMRGPGHERPDDLRERVGLDEERDPEPGEAPPPPDPDRTRPAPLEHD
jgi:hypothetical protein